MISTKEPVPLFISYSHKDEAYKDKLLTFLEPLKSNGMLAYWEASQLLIGSTYTQEIISQVNRAKLFLLLVSSDSIASEYIKDIELKRAFARYGEGEAIIIPVILKPCAWQKLPIQQFHAVPIGGKAVTLWENEDEAFLTIVEQIEKLVQHIWNEKKAKPLKENIPKEKPPVQEVIGANEESFTQKSTYGTVKADTFIGQVKELKIEIGKEKKKS